MHKEARYHDTPSDPRRRWVSVCVSCPFSNYELRDTLSRHLSGLRRRWGDSSRVDTAVELKPGCTGRNVVCRNRLSSNHILTDGYTGERGRHVTGLRRLAEPSATSRGTARRWREEVVPGASLLRVVSLGGRAGTSPPPRGGGNPCQFLRDWVHGG